MPEAKEHLVGPGIYVGVLVALMVLLAATIALAFVDFDTWTAAHHLGSGWNTAIAISIAILKGVLILLFFMHVKYGTRLTWIFAAAGFVWLGIMLTMTMCDYYTRNHPPGISAKGEPKFILPSAKPEDQRPKVDIYPGQPGSYH